MQTLPYSTDCAISTEREQEDGFVHTFFAIVMLTMVLPIWVYAQNTHPSKYSEKQLFEAFLNSDMSVWKAYIDEVEWSKLSIAEKKRRLNYEYGYIAPTIDAKEAWAEEYLIAFEAHVEEMYEQKAISEAHYNMYMSSAKAYDFMLHRNRLFSSGLRSKKHVDKAMELAPNDPFVLTLMANVLFYAPSALGGDKETAMRYFSQAKDIFEKEYDYSYLWNYASLRLCIAQCQEKTGDKKKAIESCEDILRTIPNFAFVRDIYLPQLRGE